MDIEKRPSKENKTQKEKKDTGKTTRNEKR